MNLFDPATTVPTECQICGAVRQPGQETTPDCENDHDKLHGDYTPRPKGCLNGWHPHPNDPIPF